MFDAERSAGMRFIYDSEMLTVFTPPAHGKANSSYCIPKDFIRLRVGRK